MLKRIMSSKPTRMWIDGKSYDVRVMRKEKKFKKERIRTASGDSVASSDLNEQDFPSVEIKTAQEIADGSRNQNSFDIVAKEDGKFFTRFRLPSYYYMKLREMHPSILQGLSADTKTDIVYPPKGQDGEVLITGENETEVSKARTDFHEVIGGIRNELRPMQFVAIPTLSDEIRDNFEKFKNEVLALDSTGIEASIFQKATKLHLTIVVFALLDDSEKTEAAKFLQDYKDQILSKIIKDKEPLKIRICGIDCMNDNHKKVDVLYAKAKLVDETDDCNLQIIANGISDYFYEKGFVIRHENNVKLHMTLMNTKYRKTPDSPKRWVKRKSFDATKIMEKYKDYDFGTCSLETICISLMSSEGEDGFYKSLSTITVA